MALSPQTKERVVIELLSIEAKIERMESTIDHDALPSEYDALAHRRDCAKNILNLGKRGAVTFRTQGAAEEYLLALPIGYDGDTSKTESGKWMVKYRQSPGFWEGN